MKSAPPRKRVLLLDVMGTIVREPLMVEVPRFFETTLEELLPILSREAWFEFERGEIDELAFARRFFRDGRVFDCEGLKSAMVAGYDFLPGMESLLQELWARGVAMHALSNYPIWYRLIENKLRLSQYLGWSFVSCETGVRKPDAAAYTGAARALDTDTADCVFVDDRETNCAAARAVGMAAVRFTSAPELRSELVGLGVLENG